MAFVIGASFILRNTASRVIEEQQRAVNLGYEPPFASTLQEALRRLGHTFLTDGWLILLPLYGTCLFFLRVDQRIRSLRQAFIKWSVLFLLMEFTTEWTKYGWAETSAELPLMLMRYPPEAPWPPRSGGSSSGRRGCTNPQLARTTESTPAAERDDRPELGRHDRGHRESVAWPQDEQVFQGGAIAQVGQAHEPTEALMVGDFHATPAG